MFFFVLNFLAPWALRLCTVVFIGALIAIFLAGLASWWAGAPAPDRLECYPVLDRVTDQVQAGPERLAYEGSPELMCFLPGARPNGGR